MTSIFDREPDLVVTTEQAIAEGAIREMDGYGIATFRGQPIATVSDTLFRALQDAFGLAATAGLTLTRKDWKETLADRADEGLSAPGIDDLDGRTGLVPFWATLGGLLQVLISDATDSDHDGPLNVLYTTPPIKALGGEPIWLARPAPGEWTAFLPEDY